MNSIKASNQGTDHPRSWMRKYLSQDDLKAIEAGIADIEKRTSGELVVVIARRSVNVDPQSTAVTLLMLLAYMIFVERPLNAWIDSQFRLPSEFSEGLLKLGVVLLFILLSYLLARLPFFRRIAMTAPLLQEQAEMRAELEFYRSSIQETKAATGILLYVAFQDHQAVVLSDKSISAKLPPDTWRHILKDMVSGIKQKQSREGILKAIQTSGDILAEHFPVRPGDTNELANRVLIKD